MVSVTPLTMTSRMISITETPDWPLMTVYVIVNRSPFVGPGGRDLDPRATAPECTIPIPSSAPQPAPIPLTQSLTSTKVALKLAARRFPSMETLRAVSTEGSVRIHMSHPENGSMFATWTWTVMFDPVGEVGEEEGDT